MSGTKSNAQIDVIKDPDIVEAVESTVEDLDPVQLNSSDSTKKAYIGHNLTEPGIPKDIATHKLNVDPLYPPVRQIRTKFNAAINKAVSDEVDKLLANGSIRESKYPQWVANVVMERGPHRPPYRGLRYIKTVRNEAKPRKMRLRRDLGQIPRFLGITKRHRSQFRPDEGHRIHKILTSKKQVQKLTDCIEALRKLKAYFSSPPLLAKEEPGERLLVYLAVSEVAVSAVLVLENKGTQTPIYYISKNLVDAETRYPHLEKLALALVVASRKLRPYFQHHAIAVVTTFPLRSILHIPDLSGRLAKWAIELSEHDIAYQLRTTIKSQVLADFVADFSAEILSEVKQETLRTSPGQPDLWVLYTDGASNASGFGLGLVLEVPTGEVIRQSIRCPAMTNNEAEYEAVIAGLELALKYGARRVVLRCDSQLVVNQVTGTFQIKEQRLQKYQAEIHKLLEFDECRLNQIPQAQNIEADGLAKLAATTKNITKENVVTLLHSSIDRIEAARYSLINHDLYKRTFGGPLAKCLGPSQTRRVLEEVHEGHCGARTGNRALVKCLIRAGYYWPTMKRKPQIMSKDVNSVKNMHL
ncbi:PREDICTED: uncharacterized protein LOC109217196 [Nicotiana attenuata]|uniref:uncharacterized protein LOC109217196 n=1 Tax=Nicotiana attenuata TaxID=49451 RepID=UPI00090467DC|nr:PREDICTED: uncharacterized protein LOC109217196 [Nicotiana attenuata]